MTNPSQAAVHDAPAHPELTASDAERIATAIEAELALSTRQTYAIAWRQWERWCSGRGIAPLPAAPEALAAFLAEKAGAGLTFGTLDGYCSGIAHRHHQEGFADPTASVVVRRVRSGLCRIMGVAPRLQAHPLTVAELGQIVSSIDVDTAIGIRDRAILLVGYASAMRPGEVSALNVEDIVRKPTGILINIRRIQDRPGLPAANSSALPVVRTRSPTRSGRSMNGSGTDRPNQERSLPASTGAITRGPSDSARARSAGRSRSVPLPPASTASPCPATPFAPAMPRPRPSTAPRLTASSHRPATATWGPSSITTSGPLRQCGPPPAETSGSEAHAK